MRNFTNGHWPCEYVTPETGLRCINVSNGHSKGHQTSDGKIIATGDYTASISCEKLQHRFENQVFVWLESLSAKLAPSDDEYAEAKKVHLQDTMTPFWKLLNNTPINRHLHSHTACFCCLLSVPQHDLPCGHTLCTECAKMYGESDSRGMALRLQRCPFCTGRPEQDEPWTIQLKPKSAGARILTLDG